MLEIPYFLMFIFFQMKLSSMIFSSPSLGQSFIYDILLAKDYAFVISVSKKYRSDYSLKKFIITNTTEIPRTI